MNQCYIYCFGLAEFNFNFILCVVERSYPYDLIVEAYYYLLSGKDFGSTAQEVVVSRFIDFITYNA